MPQEKRRSIPQLLPLLLQPWLSSQSGRATLPLPRFAMLDGVRDRRGWRESCSAGSEKIAVSLGVRLLRARKLGIPCGSQRLMSTLSTFPSLRPVSILVMSISWTDGPSQWESFSWVCPSTLCPKPTNLPGYSTGSKSFRANTEPQTLLPNNI